MVLTLAGMSGSSMALAQDITGAGSTFIYPVLAAWAQKYHQLKHIKVNYQPIGSGGGLRQIKAGTVDFAASDMPLTEQQLQQRHLAQFPMIVGGIVPIVNIAGIKNTELTLDGNVLAAIFEGKITYWNDAAITTLNPGVTLPHARIISVHRADGSGTTFNFTNYLDKVSPSWRKKVGFSTVVDWPGFGIGAKGNAGVASEVMHIPNAIGYVEYAYALQNHLTTIKMVNQSGHAVVANAASFASAAKSAHWKASNSFYLILTNQPGKASWPIVATTFILMPKNQAVSINTAALHFFKWSYVQGQSMAKKLDYVPIPQSVYQEIEANWQKTLHIKL
jgi:phosphate transport system substrate-binding protein